MTIGLGIGLGITIGGNGASGPGITAVPTFTFNSAPVVIQTKPSGMDSKGPFYNTRTIDMRSEAGWPYKWCMLYSTDHSTGDGGIWMSNSNDDDPSVQVWETYDVGLAAGKFSGFATKPAANPIFTKASASKQIETPAVIKLGSTWYVMYQQATGVLQPGGGAYRGQGTIAASGPDLLNLTSSDTATLTIATTDCIGDGHTGYFRFGLNKFSGVPYTYVGYSLASGGDQSVNAQWGSNDGIAWTLIKPLHRIAGRAADGIGSTDSYAFGWISIDVDSVTAVTGGYSALMCAKATGSGLDVVPGKLYEVMLDATGTQILGKPQLLLNFTNGTFYEDLVDTPAMVDVDASTRVYTIRGCQGGSNGTNRIGASKGPKRDGSQTVFSPLSPAIPASLTTTQWDFRTLTSVPASLQENGTPVSKLFDADGYRFVFGASNQEYSLAEPTGFIPQNTNFVEWWVRAWRTNSQNHRRFWLGFMGSATGLFSAQPRGLFLANFGTATTNETIYKRATIGASANGTNAQPDVASLRHQGVGYATTANANSRKTFGLRWFPKAGRLIMLGEGAVEMEEFAYPVDWDMSVRLYPMFGVRYIDQNNNERIWELNYRIG